VAVNSESNNQHDENADGGNDLIDSLSRRRTRAGMVFF